MISPEAMKLMSHLLLGASILLLTWVIALNVVLTLTATWAIITIAFLSTLGMTIRYLAYRRSNGNGSK